MFYHLVLDSDCPMSMTDLYEPTDAERLIQQTVRDIADEYGHEYWLECQREDRTPVGLLDTFAEQGFFGVNIPEEYGGSEMGIREMRMAVEEIARQGMSAEGLVTNATMTATVINRHASEELKERFLPAIADGDVRFAFALTEPDAGSNSFRMRTRIERDGDEYVINGQKTWITNIDDADYVQLVGRTTPFEDVENRRDGITMLTLGTEADGLTYEPIDLAMLGTDTFMVYFDDVRVPVANRIGAEGKGFDYLFSNLNSERIVTAATTIGHGLFALERGVEYANDRVLYDDDPIASYQGIQHPMAEAKIALEESRLSNIRAAEAVQDEDQNAGGYAAIAAYSSSQAAEQAVDAAIQAHGGNGFVRDYGVINVERTVRHSRIAPLNDEQALNYVGQYMLGMPKSY